MVLLDLTNANKLEEAPVVKWSTKINPEKFRGLNIRND